MLAASGPSPLFLIVERGHQIAVLNHHKEVSCPCCYASYKRKPFALHKFLEVTSQRNPYQKHAAQMLILSPRIH